MKTAVIAVLIIMKKNKVTTNELIKYDIIYIYSIEHYLAVRKDKILPFALIRVEKEILTEKSSRKIIFR